ncbi:MAG: DNA polymerase I [Alphaproteobacteria bacterium]
MTAAAKGKSRRPHLILVDGSGYIFRAYYALPPMNRSDGTPTNAVFGFCSMLMKLMEDIDADHVAVIFDAGRKTFRNDIYPDYKANRSDPPEDLIPQFDLIREATRAFNLPCEDMAGFEADDLIATYARAAAAEGAEVTIMTSDKDLMQLVDGDITMIDPIRNRPIGADEVREKFGVGPDKVVDVQALAGDSTDNVPGVPGIGVKTAAELINHYGDLDTLLARAGEIKQPKRRQNLIEFADQARLSRELVRLKDDVPVTGTLESFAVHKPDPETLLGFLRAQGFKRLVARVESDYAADGIAVAGEGDKIGAGAGTVIKAEIAPETVSYVAVQDEDALKHWIARATEAGVIAVDTETTSLDAMRAELVGVSLSLTAGEACYIPLAHRTPKGQGSLDLGGGDGDGKANGEDTAPEQIPRDRALKLLAPLLADPAVLKIGHNIKYDMLVLAKYGIEVAPVDDTMVLSYVLEGGLHGHGMDELAQLHLGHDTIKFKDVAGTGKNQVTFDEVPLAAAVDYAAEDADITGRLERVLKPRLAAEHMTTVYETIERPLIPVLAAMELTGIKLDRGVLAGLSEDFTKRLAVLGDEIHRLAGRDFNIASPKQLGEVLFEDMGLPGGKKSKKTGAYATGADILDDLAAQGFDLPGRVLDWRQIAKLKSTYSDALVGQINPETGRVHTSYAQAVASTGRLSSTDPNLQNIPVRTEEGRNIRRAFIAEDGFKLISADYSQIELRLLAHVAGIEVLADAFRGGADIHALTASQVFGMALDDIDSDLRRKAKAINFGIIYGISPFGLARQLGIPQAEAADYIKAYFQRYPGIQDYMEEAKAFCRDHGYVQTIFGRKCHLPGIKDKNPARRNFSERAAINAPLQGAAADIIKRAMIRMPAALEAAKLGARMLLQVHDELIFEVPSGETAKTVEVVTRVMADAALPALELTVPIEVEAGVGDNWAEIH